MSSFDRIDPAHFPNLMEALLGARAICEYRYPRLHRLLDDEQSPERETAERILEVMGRRLEQTEGVYYAVYDGCDDTVYRSVDELFVKYLKDARVVTEFFELLRQTRRGGEILEPGESFAFASTLDRITASRPSVDKLMELRSMVSRSTDRSPSGALQRVIARLVETGYLHQLSRGEETYVLTGEYVLFRQWRDFVAEQEGIDLDADDPQQGDSGEGQQPLL